MSSSANWRLRVRDKVYKEIARFPERDGDRILKAIESLPFNPYVGDIEKMKGEINAWRRRMGNYRIFYEIIPDDGAIYVFRAERRTSKTY
ncbi:MAG: type II toxin-antitoxin system RelE/ParE family toxin [bacterium]|nr:type II toxin-antitoxin system RelE/ParE family toxin [bacterium]